MINKNHSGWRLQSFGGAHADLAVKAVSLIRADAVDIDRAVLLATKDIQLFSGIAFSYIAHGDFLKKYAIGTLIQLGGVACKIYISDIADMPVDVRIGIIELPLVVKLHIVRESDS